KVGEKMRARDALAALLISSSGDVAYAIAEHVGGTVGGFVDMMNKKAEEMGLSGTHYTNPVGLHDDNLYTTAKDIYTLAKFAFSNDKIKGMLEKVSYTMEATNYHKELTIYASNLMINPNSNVYYKYAVCGKTGFTDKAGRCLVNLSEYNGYKYITVVLGTSAPNGIRYDFIDSANMCRWAFNNFEFKSVLEATTPIAEAPLKLSGETDHLPICFEDGLKTILPKEADASTIEYKISLKQPEFTAPIKKGAIVGSADVFYAEEKIGTLNLVSGQTIEASPLLVFLDSVKTFFTSSFMKGVYIVVVAAIIIFVAAVFFLNKGKKKKRRVKYVPLSKEERGHNASKK
ncbi:MAG: D-alanyl-D-alanine carboxypeptidase, partial [Clostridia bacterium]|nr:D-alanyl-D-alanine carboxypeptidase [Clostridia bacterium]